MRQRTIDTLTDARELLDVGETPEVIAERLGTTVAALDQAFRRAGDAWRAAGSPTPLTHQQ